MTRNAAEVGKKEAKSARANAAGVCTIDFQSNGRVVWIAQQVTIDMQSAPAGSVAFMYHNDDVVTPLIPAVDAAGGDPNIPLQPGDILRVRWTGVTPGAQGKATLWYEEAKYQ